LELFKDIEGIGWNHVADKNADWWKFWCEMVAIEVVAIAAGAFTGSAGFWAVNAARGAYCISCREVSWVYRDICHWVNCFLCLIWCCKMTDWTGKLERRI
jgi:hypothetical protein